MTSRSERLALLQRIVDVFSKREAEFMAVASQEMGTPLSAVSHFRNAVEQFREMIKVLQDYEFEHRLGGNVVRREPIGVCGLIAPWNWPIPDALTKVAPAMAAGCTMVLKPSEYTPLTSVLLARSSARRRRAARRVQPGDRRRAGRGPCDVVAPRHRHHVLHRLHARRHRGGAAAADTVKRVCQELGGKSANVVLPDADLEAAARWNVARGTFNTGQSCHSPSRILVHESQARPAGGTARARDGQARRSATRSRRHRRSARSVNKAQFERIQRYIQIGIDEGARLVSGGAGRPSGLERGYFVKPTLFAGVRPT